MFPIRIPMGAWGKAVAAAARENGCEPRRRRDEDGDIVWSCTCKDELHFGDQQCSIITADSAARRRDGKPPVHPVGNC